ncbi:MAG: 16S rRNA (uracil(1498)-N(3))-methyltransferase [Methylococcales bacterium]
MRISRIHVASSLVLHEKIRLEEEAAHYVRAVLRLKVGAEVFLFNDEGAEFKGELTEVTRKAVVAKINEPVQRKTESRLWVNYGLAISRSDHMDFAIQKAVELGVSEITPLLTARSVVRLKPENRDKKSTHWQRIAQNAAEQSGRQFVPKIHQPVELGVWVNQLDGFKILLDPTARQALGNLSPGSQKVVVMSGPEGGFTQDEIDSALAMGFVAIRLGPRVLRTETAALAVLTSVQLLWGDLNV